MGTSSNKSKSAGRWSGKAVLFISGVHTVLGALMFARVMPDPGVQAIAGDRNVLRELLTKWSWAPSDPMLMAAFWFFFFGFGMIPLGQLLKSIEDKGQDVPKSVGWSLVALGLGGGLCMPASGFWTIFVPAWNILSRRQ